MSGRAQDEDPDARGRIHISDEETRLLREIIEEHCGVAGSSDLAFRLERRLGGRLRALGIPSFLDYYHYLRFDENGPFELDECVELINTHETYFFREQFQLDVFTRDVLPSLTRGEGSHRPLAFWSAGCSTGEEAYTIAILLREQPSLREWKLRVVGSDISRKVLDVARAGVYTESSFRTTSPAIRARYFEPVTGGYRVIEPVRRMCSFRQLNLLRTADYRDVGRFDVIFCRNVLMYLTPAARHQIVEAFHDTLTPGGFLLLGHSESLLNVHTRFETVQFGQDIVYQRPTGDAP